MKEQEHKEIMAELRENAYIPLDQDDIITTCLGLGDEIDEDVTDNMPGTKWESGNAVAFASGKMYDSTSSEEESD